MGFWYVNPAVALISFKRRKLLSCLPLQHSPQPQNSCSVLANTDNHASSSFPSNALAGNPKATAPGSLSQSFTTLIENDSFLKIIPSFLLELYPPAWYQIPCWYCTSVMPSTIMKICIESLVSKPPKGAQAECFYFPLLSCLPQILWNQLAKTFGPFHYFLPLTNYDLHARRSAFHYH